MKIKMYMIAFLLLLAAACGSENEGASEFGNPDDDMGTVVLKAGVGSALPSGSVSKEIVRGEANELMTRTYQFSLGDSANCEEASFIDVFDDSSDTSDCQHPPVDTTNFFDAMLSPTIATNDAIEPNVYSCVRVKVCDQLIWSTDKVPQCPGQRVSDIYDPRDEGGVVTVYYSIDGSNEDREDEAGGSATYPYPLSESLVVTAGETTTTVIDITNDDDNSTIVAEYNSENSEEFQCEITAPSMTILAE